MLRFFAFACSALPLAALSALMACGGKTECDASRCAAGNQCIEDQGEVACRLPCDAQTGENGCPTNYTCRNNGKASFCAANSYAPTPAAGQFGARCDVKLGLVNPGCDSAQGFYCKGDSVNDPTAYCTLFDCTSDDQCAGGYYCGSVNKGPNADTKQVLPGPENSERACLPRDYCAPCSADVDCGPGVGGAKQYCIADADGRGFCTSACTRDTNCNDEARCAPIDDALSVCYPIADRCVGDGALCSPCLSNADCTAGGQCIRGLYTSERTCSQPSPSNCGERDCNAPPENMSECGFVGCSSREGDNYPAGHCLGLVPLNTNRCNTEEHYFEIGCYARSRRDR